jgi:hypothetical protein
LKIDSALCDLFLDEAQHRLDRASPARSWWTISQNERVKRTASGNTRTSPLSAPTAKGRQHAQPRARPRGLELGDEIAALERNRTLRRDLVAHVQLGIAQQIADIADQAMPLQIAKAADASCRSR